VGVAGSNPATPTKLPADNSASCRIGPEAHKGEPGQLSGQKQRSRLRALTAAPLRIVIEPTENGRKWIARLGDRVLCVSASPFVKSARLLLAEDLPAATVIEMWRPNTDESALQGRLGAAAATVIDGETASRCAKNGAPTSDTEKSALQRAAGLRSSSGRS
jgi:hypothetical protein